jgi:hypothetical protein
MSCAHVSWSWAYDLESCAYAPPVSCQDAHQDINSCMHLTPQVLLIFSSVVLVFCFSEIFLCVLGVQLILQ